jgi:hypothetical protein
MELECHYGVALSFMCLTRAIQECQIHMGQAFSLISRAWTRDQASGPQDQRMQIRVKSGLPRSRPSLASQIDGSVYLNKIVRRSTLIGFVTSGDLRLDVDIHPGLSFDDLRPLFVVLAASLGRTDREPMNVEQLMLSLIEVVCACEDGGIAYNTRMYTGMQYRRQNSMHVSCE